MRNHRMAPRSILFAGAVLLALTATTFSATAPRAPAKGLVRDTNSQQQGMRRFAQGYDGSSEYYEVGAENDSSAYPFNVYGIEGFVPNDVGGVGVLGYGEAAKSYGVYGVSFGTNGIGVYGSGDGPTPAPSGTPSSTQQSTGVVGDSHSGDGVFGSTEFPNESNGMQVAGVVGMDEATTQTSNSGVLGLTTTGSYGTVGISTGANSSGAGVLASSAGGPGLFAISQKNSAVEAVNFSGLFVTATPPPEIYDQTGVYAFSTIGSGVFAASYLDPPIAGEKDCNTYTTGATESGANCSGFWLEDLGTNGYELEIYNSSNNTYPMYSTSGGNLYLTGHMVDAGGTFVRSRNTATDELTYAAQQTESTIEDLGSAQLRNGAAHVALGADFRQTIDANSAYMVFLTPYGDSRGLYVASRSAEGFTVREAQGGRSSMTFDYRIVARPYGARAARLPHESVLNPHRPMPLSPSALARHRTALRPRFEGDYARFKRADASRAAAATYIPRPNLAAEFRRN